jgi:hypothetical protein
MQITITERNFHEGETFSYILDVSEEITNKIELFCKNVNGKIPAEYRIDKNTEFTSKQVKLLNEQVNNGYMNRYDFYELPQKIDFDDSTLFYKGGILKKQK